MVNAIAEATETRTLHVFLDGESIDGSEPAKVEVPRVSVVKGMGSPPAIVREEGEYANPVTDPGTGSTGAEERSVPEVVLNREQPGQEPGGWDRKQEGEGVADLQAPEH